jgi:hypothetical protein
MKQTFILGNPAARERCFKAVATAGDNYVVTVSEPKRSLQQNALMWALLSDLAEQIDWHGLELTAENWKDMCTAAVKRQQVVPGLDGGFVVLGTSTSKMTKVEMNELIEFIYAFGAQHGVKFSEFTHDQ